MNGLRATDTVLDRIVADAARRLEAARARTPEAALEAAVDRSPPVRPILPALSAARRPFVIAEIKRASPSRGVLRAEFDPSALARAYERGGAGAVSVLTEADHFQGSLDHLRAVRQTVGLPLLRKDFIFDAYQLLEARAVGADFFLLLAVLLEAAALRRLIEAGRRLGMTALVEVHTEEEMQSAAEAGAEFIGINNRNLKTFETRLEVFEALAPRVPRGIPRVAESGISTRADMERLARAGANAYLIGESLMRSPDPGRALMDLVG